MRRLVFALSAALLGAALLAQVGSARNPGGRTSKAVFSAGASGVDGAGALLVPAAPFLDALVRVSTDDGVTAAPDAVELATSGRVFLDSQTEPWADVNPSDSRNVVGMWQEDRWSSGGARNLVFGTSFDAGKTWTNLPLAGITHVAGGDYERATDPWVDFGPGNRVYATSLAFDDSGPDNAIFVHTSADGGKTWPQTALVIRDTSFTFFNDKQALVADDGARSSHRGSVYIAWDRLIEDPLGAPFVGTYTGPAMFSRSTDGGRTFSAPEVIFATGTNKQTIGNVPLALPDGTVVVAGTYLENGSLGKNAQKLWVVRSSDGGRTFSAPELPLEMQSLPVAGIRSGDTVPSFAVDRRTGTIYAAWQDIRFSKGKRNDVLVTSSQDAGRTWAAPVQANDTPPGAQDAFTPAIQVDASGRVGVLYYDLRDDSSAKDEAILTAEWLALSTDGGRTFGPSTRITEPFDHRGAAFAGGLFLGDYQALGVAGNAFQPFFAATLAGGSDVYSTRIR
jgi:hypothetical protein